MNDAVATDGLRGLHLPVEPGWWPPGPAWWIAALVVAALIIFAVIVIARRRDARRWQLAALSEWRSIKGIGLNNPGERIEVVQACSRLLRRVALALFPRLDVAGLTGERWLMQLDNLGQTSAFSNGVGRLLVDAPYKPESPKPREVAQLLELTRTTIRRAAGRSKVQGADR